MPLRLIPGLSAITCAVAFTLPAVPCGAVEDGRDGRRLDARNWRYRVPVVVENASDHAVSAGVTRVQINLHDSMEPDLGDIRVIRPNGVEVPSLVTDVRDFLHFNVLFEISVAARSGATYQVLFGNPEASRTSRLSLVFRPANLVANPGFEEADPANPKLPATWNCRRHNIDTAAGSGRTTEVVFSGRASMKTRTGNWATNQELAALFFNLPEPVTRGQHLVLAASCQAHDMPSGKGCGGFVQIPRVAGVGFPKFDHEWTTRSRVFPSLPVPFADTGKTNGEKAGEVLYKSIYLLVGSHHIRVPRKTVMYFDDIFLGRYFDLDARVGSVVRNRRRWVLW